MAEKIPTFDAKAPRRGRIAVNPDNGAADAFATLAAVSGQIAGRLTEKVAQQRKAQALDDAAAETMAVSMPGVEFAF
jgi:hypothetical protein